MAGYGGRSGGGRKSGGSSVAAGRKAQARYKMANANARWKAGQKSGANRLPYTYAPKNTRR